jgi:chromosome partitioning protein
MLDLNAINRTLKCARVVGETIGKYSPHGDSSVYEAMIVLGQWWKTKMPLIYVHGNYGTLMGDGAAAMRYTESKISDFCYDAIIGDISIKKATIPTFIKNLFIMPSNISLSGAGMELSKRENYHVVLKDTLKDVIPLFDYIFIDLPPSLGVITVNALVASDSVLIPIQAEYYALEGVADLINTIKLVEKRLRSPTPIKGILLTLYDKRTRLSKDVHKELKNYFGGTDLLFKTIIPRNIRLAEAPSFGKPCLIYDPDSTGTKAYLKLAKEILKRDGED